MDSAQIMTTVATPQATTVMPAEAGMVTAASGTNGDGFGSLLGQVLAQLPVELAGGQEPVAEQQGLETDVLAQLIADVAAPVVEEHYLDKAKPLADSDQVSTVSEQQAAQLMASYLQAAMMVAPQQQMAVAEQPGLAVDETVPVVAETAAVASQLVPPAGDGMPVAVQPEAVEGAVFVAEREQTDTAAPVEQRPVTLATAHPQQKPAPSLQQQNPTAGADRPQQPTEAHAIAGPAVQASEMNPEVVASQEDVGAEAVTVQKPATQAPAAVKFAQQPDVVAAMSDLSDQGDESAPFERGRDETAGQQPARGKLTALPALETGNQDAGTVPAATQVRTAEHPLFGLQPARQQGAAEAVAVAETLPQVAGEQVARQVAERLTSQPLKQGADQISLKLSPEHLGNLQLNLRMDEQRLRVEVIAEQRGVRDALLQQVDELKATLARQNITMDSFDVTTGMNNGQNQQPTDWRQAASERRPLQVQQYAAGRSAAALSGGMDSSVRYFAPQYQSTLDVRF